MDIHTKCPFRNLGSRYRLKIILELQQTVGGGTYILYVCAGTNQAHTTNSMKNLGSRYRLKIILGITNLARIWHDYGTILAFWHVSGTNLARFWHDSGTRWHACKEDAFCNYSYD